MVISQNTSDVYFLICQIKYYPQFGKPHKHFWDWGQNVSEFLNVRVLVIEVQLYVLPSDNQIAVSGT